MGKSTYMGRAPSYLAAIFLILACTVTVMMFINRSLQAGISERQVYINQTTALSQVNQALIKSLGAASVRNAEIKRILTDAGFTVTYNPGGRAEQAPASTAP